MTLFILNAALTEQIFDGGFCACFCTKGDSGNLSGGAACYEIIFSAPFAVALDTLAFAEIFSSRHLLSAKYSNIGFLQTL